MPQSTKDIRKLRKKQAEERGEDHSRKKAPATFAVCTFCKVRGTKQFSKKKIPPLPFQQR
jgi:hypothetical protein